MYFKILIIVVLHFILVSIAGCNNSSNKSKLTTSPDSSKVSPANTLLATIPESISTEVIGTVGKGSTSKVQNLFQVSFNEGGRGVAYVMEAGDRVRVALNGKIGKPYQSVGAMALSPDGRRVAYSVQEQDRSHMVIDTVDAPFADSVGTPVFSPDSRHVAYEATISGKGYLYVDDKKGAPSSSKFKYYYHDKFFSADSREIISIELAEDDTKAVRVTVSDLTFSTQRVKEIQAADFVLNGDKSRIALIGLENGKQKIVEFAFNNVESVTEGPLYDVITQQTYGADGVSLAYVAERGGERFVVLNGKEELLPYRDKIESVVIRPDMRGVGILLSSDKGFFLHQAFVNDGARNKRYAEAANLIYSRDGNRYAFVAKKGKDNIFMVVNGAEGPAFDMIVTPMFSPDGNVIVYRARKDGKRFVVVADATGKIVRQHPAYEMVYQPVFSDDGKSIGYGVKDGRKLAWKVEKL
jgi:Tol biopolymer transport system component